jgi:hypothetical protein
MSEINAIATNNYLLATQQEVSHDNTLSGNGTVDSPLGVVPGYNETVLWEGTMSASGVSASYSEPALNFEYLRFIGSTNDSPPTNAFIIETPTYPISASTLGVTYGSTMFAANWGLKAISMKSSDTEFTKYVEREMSYTNTAWSNYECHYNIYKVIGVNRISGNE